MANTYTGNPSLVPLDRVRFLINDKAAPWLFSDEEINSVIEENPENLYLAAEELALTQAGTFTNLRDKTVGPLSIKYGSLIDRWTELAKSLRLRSTRRSGGGPIAVSTQGNGATHVRLGIHDNFRYGSTTYPDNLLGEQ